MACEITVTVHWNENYNYKQKRALYFHFVGSDVDEIFDSVSPWRRQQLHLSGRETQPVPPPTGKNCLKSVSFSTNRANKTVNHWVVTTVYGNL